LTFSVGALTAGFSGKRGSLRKKPPEAEFAVGGALRSPESEGDIIPHLSGGGVGGLPLG